jgi:hypothetical protein
LAEQRPIVKPIQTLIQEEDSDVVPVEDIRSSSGLNVVIVQPHEIKRVRGKGLSVVNSQYELPNYVKLSVCVDDNGRVVDSKIMTRLPRSVKRRLNSVIRKWRFSRAESVERNRTVCSTIKEKLWTSDIIDTPLF